MAKKEHNIATILLLNARNEILLQKKELIFKRWPGRWSMFGGGIEHGETPEEAVRREVKEELDVELGEVKLFKVFDYTDEDRAGKMHIFTSRFAGETSDISLKEGAGFAFFANHEIAALHLIDHDDKIVKEFIKTNN